MGVFEWTSGACIVTFDDTTGAMVISGNGAMADYSTSDTTDPDYDPDALPPWSSVMSDITSVTVEQGVTKVGA